MFRKLTDLNASTRASETVLQHGENLMSHFAKHLAKAFFIAFAVGSLAGGTIVPLLLARVANAADDEGNAKPPVAKNPKQLGELLFAAIQASDENKAAALIPPQNIAEKAIAALPFPDEETKRKQSPILQKHFSDLKPKFAAVLKAMAEFAKANKIDWKSARVVEVEAKTRVGREGVERFSKMKVRIALHKESEASVTIEMDDGSKFGDAWYFTDAPLAIEVVRDGKTVRQDLREPENQ